MIEEYLKENLISDNWLKVYRTKKSAIIGSLYDVKFTRYEDLIFHNGELLIKFE